MKTEIAYIYALIDPRDNEVRYIGKTTQPLKRLKSHIYECKNEKIKHRRAKWIRKLIKENLIPVIKFVKICPLNDFEKYETGYIKLYQSDKLTNSDETGQGNIGRKRDIIDKMLKPKSKTVYQYDINGNFIKEFKSVREASRLLNIYHSHISRCCNGYYKHTNGFIFRYEKSDNIETVSNPNAVRKSVIEVDQFGSILNKWLSIMDCSRDTGIDGGGISRTCNGVYEKIKGRYFKFSNL